MLEKEATDLLSLILMNHGVKIRYDDEYVYADIGNGLKFKCIINCEQGDSWFSSRLDIVITTATGEQIIECFGDFANTLIDAMHRNFENFCRSDLHVLLGAFDPINHERSEQIEREEWAINGKQWDVYIGNIVPKAIGGKAPPVEVVQRFFNVIKETIKGQPLNKQLHWFRSYYAQTKNEITLQEFLFDNWPLPGTETLFSNLPLIPGNEFCSCRNFIILKQKEEPQPAAKGKLFQFFRKKKAE